MHAFAMPLIDIQRTADGPCSTFELLWLLLWVPLWLLLCLLLTLQPLVSKESVSPVAPSASDQMA